MKWLFVSLTFLLVVAGMNRADDDGFVAPRTPAAPKPIDVARNVVHGAVPDLIDRPMFSIDVGKPYYFTANFSRDGEQLATVANRKELLLLDATTGGTILRADTQSDIFSAKFAPDGKHAILTGRGGLRLIDLATGKQIRTLMGGGHTRCDISPDGQTLAVGTMNGATFWETKTWKHVGELIPDQKAWFSSVVYRGDGKQLLTCGHRESKVKIWDTQSWKQSASFDMGKAPVYTAVWNPTGSKVAASSTTYVKLWDVATGEELLELKGHNRYSVAFSADGQLLATADGDNVISVRRAQDGHELYRLKGHQSTVMSVAFRPDGKHLASTSKDGTVKVWEWASSSSSDSN